jgi:hypothetical protein
MCSLYRYDSFLDSQSQMTTDLSSPPDATSLTSYEKTALLTQLVCWNPYWNLRSLTDHILTDLSSLALTNSYPSHENCTLLTGAEWALMTTELPSTVLFHNRMVSSLAHEAIRSPLGENWTSLTYPLCPMNL